MPPKNGISLIVSIVSEDGIAPETGVESDRGTQAEIGATTTAEDGRQITTLARDAACLALDHHAHYPDHGPGQDQGAAQFHGQGNDAGHGHPGLAQDPDPGRDQSREPDLDRETTAKAQTRKERGLTLDHHPAPGHVHLAVHALVSRGQGLGHQALQSRTNNNNTRMTRIRQPGNRTTGGDRVRDPKPGTDQSHGHGHGPALDRDLAQGKETLGLPETDRYLANDPQVVWMSSSQRTMASARKSTVRLKSKVLVLIMALQ